jgi:hypothetical protein
VSRAGSLFDHTLRRPTRGSDRVVIGMVLAVGGRTPPLSCPRPADQAYQKRTKYRQIYRYLPLLTPSNLFRVNSRWVDWDRVKVAL